MADLQKKVVVVGAGTMGSQIALQTAYSGHHTVELVDSSPEQLERARQQTSALVQRSVEKGRLTADQAAAALDRISARQDLSASLAEASLVIEAVFEDLDTKLGVWREMGRAAPADALLASNSSTIAISRLAGVTGRPEMCCNIHFFHPATAMELCEVVRGPETSDHTVQAAVDFVRSIGRVPVVIQKEVHGFVVNRILFAAAEEAMRLLEGGYASAQDIDTAVKKGLRWPMGPFEVLDFSGLDVFYGALKDRRELEGGPEAPAVLTEKIEKGDLGRKTGRGFYDYGEDGGRRGDGKSRS
ncbi:MAG: 3-hydroxyacyl-CoA dehydrogenase [Candidatus Nephthysia bennettiae]|uniref:3-hydroxyacyl-CoA dehydrogenase family protein n=1 Tax=Candidatus Nephthysia bennettiae TaxID=3127016 RepID=A0A934K820_9BACT|nr:3-hydroxyacyl-CoA dehydrogenase family protein [Candidatus Dormibacteraeota bacterium]PZR87385.1 MAG: 3-hydroxyacyl-CoA dehydrogenase [Candidatus Dormibacteraeota bacterium]